MLAVNYSNKAKPPLKGIWRITKYKGGTREIIHAIK